MRVYEAFIQGAGVGINTHAIRVLTGSVCRRILTLVGSRLGIHLL